MMRVYILFDFLIILCLSNHCRNGDDHGNFTPFTDAGKQATDKGQFGQMRRFFCFRLRIRWIHKADCYAFKLNVARILCKKISTNKIALPVAAQNHVCCGDRKHIIPDFYAVYLLAFNILALLFAAGGA